MNQKKSKTLKLIEWMPIINIAYKISNAYAYRGDVKNIKNTAPLTLWKSRIGKNLLFSIIVGVILSLVMGVAANNNQITFDPEDAILSIFPDILGFGIGVFALLFALPNEFLTKLGEGLKTSEASNKNPGAQMLPADMAFPLLVYCLIMLFAVFFRALPDIQVTTYLSTIFLVYGFVVTLELLSSIYSTASFIIFIRKRDLDKKEETKQAIDLNKKN